ncbi:hypothetical protein ACVIHA_009027 [Bradyrhizobium liaoningense]
MNRLLPAALAASLLVSPFTFAIAADSPPRERAGPANSDSSLSGFSA